MDLATQLDEMLEVFGRLGIPLRREQLGGAGGGLCTLRGQRVVFLDLDADLATQVERCTDALAALPEAEDIYLAPALRERIARAGTVEPDE